MNDSSAAPPSRGDRFWVRLYLALSASAAAALLLIALICLADL